MKILFISSGNSKSGISPIVKNQGLSLIKEGVKVDFFTIKGGGAVGYFKNIKRLKRYIKSRHYDIFHVHYSLSAFVAAFAGCHPLVVSLMGSDVKERNIYRYLIHFFNFIFWDAVIVKSKDMRRNIHLKKADVIPNGVDLERFYPFDLQSAKRRVGFEALKKHVIFLANPMRKEKNFMLAEKAFTFLSDSIELRPVYHIDNSMIPVYLNAADCLLLTSLWEGSPNVIKEAMACNCPIVSTDVGDVSWVIGKTKGCHIADHEPEDIAVKLQKVLSFSETIGRTNGRQRIIDLGLDSQSIAKRLFKVYEKVLEKYER